MPNKTATPLPRLPDGMLTSQNSANQDELIDMLSIAQISAALALNSLLVLLSQSPATDALYNSASRETVVHWLSVLLEMGQTLTQSTSDHPRMQTFILKGLSRTSGTEHELSHVHGELYTMNELPNLD